MRLSLLLFVSSCAALLSAAELAPTPPMGWNSWDAYGYTVTEAEVKTHADYMAAHLAKYGWQYVVVDIEWYTPKVGTHGYIADPTNVTMDKYGRLTPAVNRFPSAADGAGFKPLANYVHSKGLKFGIHIMRGIPRLAVDRNLPIEGSHFTAAQVANKANVCTWPNMTDMYGVDMSKPGGQDYYDSIARLYASWGVDYIKADDMARPYQGSEIAGLSDAMRKSGRPMALSLSPGAAPLDRAEHLRKYAQLWRISDDFWDEWKELKQQFDRAAKWAPYSGNGAWPDADMLPLGRIGVRAERGDDRRTRFTKDEQVTMMTLWSIFRSPLMFGGELPSNDAFTTSLITNAEVLAVNQHSTDNKPVIRNGALEVWAARPDTGPGHYIAVFNTGEAPLSVHQSWQELGLKARSYRVRDLWDKKDHGSAAGLEVTLRPHAAMLYRLSE
jgi:alpha-galactosidase